jgi:hypothetical protein
MYYALVIILMVIAPIVSVAVEASRASNTLGLIFLIGKWFVFWGVGVRLFTAGIKQALQPDFTAKILDIKSNDALVVVRELGFANMAIGAVGLGAALNNNWIVPGAIAGAIFYGAAGIQHLFKHRDTVAESVALVSDLLMATIAVGFLISRIF